MGGRWRALNLLPVLVAVDGAFATDSTLDCKVHILAVQFASQIQPERDMAAVAAGLQVLPDLSNCSFGPVPPPAPPTPPPPPPPPPPNWPAAGQCSVPVAGWSLAQESGAQVIGTPQTAAECEGLCRGIPNCTGYTWHDKTTGSFYKDCYATYHAHPWSDGLSDTAGHLAGICNHGQPRPPYYPPPVPPKGSCSDAVEGWSLTTAPHGNNHPTGQTPTPDGCAAKCLAAPKCTAYTWHDKTQGPYALDCYLMEDGDTWQQGSAEAGHFTALCSPNSVSEHPHNARPSLALQSYGGVMRSPLIWPVPGQGNERQQPGYLRPADGQSRSRGLKTHRHGVPAVVSAASTLYVDFGTGSDQNSGMQAAPLKTIAAAVAKVPALPAPRTIFLAGDSLHYVPDTIRITPAHSHLTILPADPSIDAVVSGGVEFTPKWTAVSNTTDGSGTVFTTPVPAGLTFLELFNSSTSARYVPAREPNGNVELDQNNYGSRAAAWLPAVDFGPATVITNSSYIDPTGKNVSLNRGGMFDEYSVGVGGPANNFKPAVSYWAQPSPRGGGASTYTIPSGMIVGPSSKNLKPGGKDGFVFMMQTHAWGSWVYEIASTSENSSGTSVKFGKGGQQEARGTGSPSTGGGSFYISHREEFLDTALEWYLNKTAGTLSLAVPVGAAPPKNLIAPVAKQLFSLEGSQIAPVIGVRLSELTFRHVAPTYMEDYAVGSGGDYSVYQGGVVHLNGTSNCTVDHNLFDAIGGNGVFLTDYNQHTLVSANEMRHIGENGIAMRGSTVWVDGRGGNQPRFNEISGNIIHHLGLYTKQSCAIFSAVSSQNLIKENIMFHGPRALVNMNDGFGGDTRIERNLMFASLLETSDHGPYNSWDRLPFLTNVKFNNGTGSISLAFNRLVSNFFFTGSPFAIDTDDGSDMVNATANVIFKQPLFKTDFGGHTKAYARNVEIYGGGCGCVTGDSTNQFVANKCVGEVSPCSCAAANNSFDIIESNTYYSTAVNVTTAVCPSGTRIESGSTNAPMLSTDGVLQLARAALGMPAHIDSAF